MVLAILVPLPFASRPWALPVLVALYRSPPDNQQRGRPHRTPTPLLHVLLRLLVRWLPDRPFLFAGDQSYGSPAMALRTPRTQGRLHVVSKFDPNANLYEPPPAYAGNGRPRVQGGKLATPREVVATAERTRLNVAWYGGGRRDVEVVTATGPWSQAGEGLVAVRGLYVPDRTGTHRDEYCSSPNGARTAPEIVEEYTGRWHSETTFEDRRAYLGLESTRGRCARTVGRAEPCWLGLYSVVALLYWWLPSADQEQGVVDGAGKATVPFSDALTAVRRWLWTQWVFPRAGHADTFAKLPEAFQRFLLAALAPAA